MCKVLIVDDDFSSRRLLGQILRDKAICDFAVNGIEALKALEIAFAENIIYDLILLDFSMPEMDGIEMLKQLREKEKDLGRKTCDWIPVIMVTAHPEVFMRSFKAGVDDYILKPVDAKDLLKKVEDLRGKRKPK